jgi:hypothetical protein
MRAHQFLGLILLREGIVSQAGLNQALAEQGHRRAAGALMPLGALVIELGLASEGQLRHALRLQKKLAWDPEGPVPLGIRLIESDLLTPSRLVALLEEEARSGEPLEQLLINRQVVQPAMMTYFKQQE